MARVALTDDNGALYGAPANWANGKFHPKTVHLIGLWGQSNMSGRGEITNSTITDPTHPRIFQVGSKTRTLRAATEPLDMHDTPTGIGPGFQVARRYLQVLPPEDVVVLVPSAHGGTMLSTNTTPLGWRWGVAGNLSEQAVTHMNDAVTLAQTEWPGAAVTIDGILWAQGETDSSTTNMVDGFTYRDDLEALINGARTAFNLPNLPFIIGQMLPEALGTGTRDAINTVHSQIPHRLPRAGFSLSAPSGNSNGDALHFNAKGQRINGENMHGEFERVRVGLAPVNPVIGSLIETIFADDFTRADGPVGTTTVGGLTWSIYGTGTPAANVSANTLALSNGTTSARTAVTVDAGTPNGTFRASLPAIGDGSAQTVFRYSDINNHLMLSRQSGSSVVWTLWKRVAGAASVVYASTTPMVDGDALEVRLNGTWVGVKVNGADIWSGTLTDQSTATRYGATTVNSWTARWDNFEFQTL